ncbi:MAG: hypothetical protein GX877_06075 [Bacteroidales bacterium]|nr:hypothetical protein [Bacteroidales bacterium]
MKKYLILIALVVPFALTGQNAWDAYRYSQLSYQGTARSMALGNAVTALGGDFGSLSLNPAAVAAYPYSEFTFTPALTSRFSAVDYFDVPTNDRYSRMGLSQFGYTGTWNTAYSRGLISLSFAAGYNKVQDFTEQTSVRLDGSTTSWLSPVAIMTNGIPYHKLEQESGYNPYYDSGAPWLSILAWNTYLLDVLPGTDDQYIGGTENLDEEYKEIYVGGLLDQRFIRESKGSMGDYSFVLGANFGDRFFLGTGLTFRNIYYQTFEKFTETAQNSDDFETRITSYSHTYQQVTTGAGYHFQLGFIALPIHNLQVALSVTTPTWTALTDEWQQRMTARFLDGYEHADSPYGNYSYKVRTPWRYRAGLSYVFGKAGLITFDYEGVDYRSMHMAARYDKLVFDDENDAIRHGSDDYKFGMSHIFRAGGEVRMANFVIRGGYGFYGAGEANLQHTHIASGGLGIRGKQCFADLGVSYRLKENKDFALDNRDGILVPEPVLHEPVLKITNTLSRLRVALTFGVRF